MINKLRILHEFQLKSFGVMKSDISISVYKDFITFSAVHNDNVIMGEIYAHGSSNEWDIPYSKQDILDRINTEIEKKKEEIRSLESKRKCFVEMFGKYFENK